MFGVLFTSLYMQDVLGYSPVRPGAAFLPMTALVIVVAPLAGRLSARFGSRWLLPGCLCSPDSYLHCAIFSCSTARSARPIRRLVA